MAHISYQTLFITFGLAFLLTSCGGGSTNSPNSNPPITPPPTNSNNRPPEPTWTAGQFLAQSTFKDFCATPRVGPDSNGDTFQDKAGTAMHEKMWLRSWSNETYLWYDEIDDVNPTAFGVEGYFDQLKTNGRTASGALKDKFHFAQPTEVVNRRNQSGVSQTYGAEWRLVRSAPPRRIVAAFVQSGSPADLAGIRRGYELKTINGVDAINSNSQADIAVLNSTLLSPEPDTTATFVFKDNNGADTPAVNITSANLDISPVRIAKALSSDVGRIGYIQFNTFIPAGQEELIGAFQNLINENVTELVLDLRYNGGGRLLQAAQLGYMIAGSAQTNGQVFEALQYNDKTPAGNSLPFRTREFDWDTGQFTNQTLPSLNLTRVFILTSGATCSASESVINGLRGIDVEVIQIGAQTCGKPYGFVGQDNCSTTYFTIQFQGVNAKGFGDYADGFKPRINPSFDDEVKGCVVQDDFNNALGDDNEGMLSAAITYAETGACPIRTQTSIEQTFDTVDSGKLHEMLNPVIKAILTENKFLMTRERGNQ